MLMGLGLKGGDLCGSTNAASTKAAAPELSPDPEVAINQKKEQ
jgi:hypothetical protein